MSLAWLWVAIEVLNGIGHPVWSFLSGGYTPGVVTALMLLPIALTLARRLLALAREGPPTPRPGAP